MRNIIKKVKNILYLIYYHLVTKFWLIPVIKIIILILIRCYFYISIYEEGDILQYFLFKREEKVSAKQIDRIYSNIIEYFEQKNNKMQGGKIKLIIMGKEILFQNFFYKEKITNPKIIKEFINELLKDGRLLEIVKKNKNNNNQITQDILTIYAAFIEQEYFNKVLTKENILNALNNTANFLVKNHKELLNNLNFSDKALNYVSDPKFIKKVLREIPWNLYIFTEEYQKGDYTMILKLYYYLASQPLPLDVRIYMHTQVITKTIFTFMDVVRNSVEEITKPMSEFRKFMPSIPENILFSSFPYLYTFYTKPFQVFHSLLHIGGYIITPAAVADINEEKFRIVFTHILLQLGFIITYISVKYLIKEFGKKNEEPFEKSFEILPQNPKTLSESMFVDYKDIEYKISTIKKGFFIDYTYYIDLGNNTLKEDVKDNALNQGIDNLERWNNGI